MGFFSFLFKGSMERYDEDKRTCILIKYIQSILVYTRYSHMSRYKHFHFIVRWVKHIWSSKCSDRNINVVMQIHFNCIALYNGGKLNA